MLKQIFNGLLGFALPETCLSCGEVLEAGKKFICDSCREKLERFDEDHPWKKEEISLGAIDDSFSLYKFIENTPIQHLLHSLKYEKMRSVGAMFGNQIARKIGREIVYDFAVPVPLHKAKHRERTYNQSHFICKGIAESLNINVIDKCLKRTRFTETQTKLHKSERRKNVHGAFEINPEFTERIRGKNIIIADDVITTGSTILECARVLKSNGCGRVMICSVAYAMLD